jgi:hypothetical protein
LAAMPTPCPVRGLGYLYQLLAMVGWSRQVIIDRAAECFSTLKSERGMTIVHFDNVQLRCGIGPDINWGHIVVGHFY